MLHIKFQFERHSPWRYELHLDNVVWTIKYSVGENRVKHTNTVCRDNGRLINVRAVGTYSDNWAVNIN